MTAATPYFRWSKLVVELMREQGVSQNGLARQAGVSRSVVRKLVDRGHDMRLSGLEKILGVLGYELDAILKEAN